MENTVDTANVVVNDVAAAQSGGWFGMLLYCAVVFGIIYFVMVRPAKKRMAEYQKMIDSLKVGNRVLAGGIYGTIKSINEKTVELEIAHGVVVTVNKNAVAGVESK
ncbi:MAG: preprotein translocase subunit YajC [Alphaproteobacteria bacterium]|nr:preprotein translocase subunit YajC [Alphaproteobacteria bacterium]